MTVPGGDSQLAGQIRAAATGNLEARSSVLEVLLSITEAHVRRVYARAPVQEQEDMIYQVMLWLAEQHLSIFQNYRSDAQPTPYLRGVVRYQACRYFRDNSTLKRTRVLISEDLELFSGEASGPETVDRALDLRRLLTLFAGTLKPELQVVFWEYMVEERSGQEVADTLGTTSANVHQQAHRIEDKLRAWLKRKQIVGAALLTVLLAFCTIVNVL